MRWYARVFVRNGTGLLNRWSLAIINMPKSRGPWIAVAGLADALQPSAQEGQAEMVPGWICGIPVSTPGSLPQSDQGRVFSPLACLGSRSGCCQPQSNPGRVFFPPCEGGVRGGWAGGNRVQSFLNWAWSLFWSRFCRRCGRTGKPS